ncbi:MAG: glycoside hydrolase family 130 protein [Bacteroidota bacterium]
MKKIVFSFIFSVIIVSLLSLPNACQRAEVNSEWTMGPFTKVDSVNPVLEPSTAQEFMCPVRKKAVKWEKKDVFNPASVVRNDTVFLLYRAEDTIGQYAGTSRIGLAYSTDGTHFKKRSSPVLYPKNDSMKQYEWEGGCEDPRVVQDKNGRYYMTYTSYDGETARLCVATSTDLTHWNKHGPAFGEARDGKYLDYWSKAGSIVCEQKDNKLVASRVNGKYLMYWGESNIYLATSDNLIDWKPILETDPEKKQKDKYRGYDEAFKIVFKPRDGKFDSQLVEPGPPALLRDDGIFLIYNSRNSPENGTKELPEGTYAGGQVLIDKNQPSQVLQRTNSWFIAPGKPYEITGQVNNVCFLEGLSFYNNRWFLYYGTADSRIAAAVSDPEIKN